MGLHVLCKHLMNKVFIGTVKVFMNRWAMNWIILWLFIPIRVFLLLLNDLRIHILIVIGWALSTRVNRSPIHYLRPRRHRSDLASDWLLLKLGGRWLLITKLLLWKLLLWLHINHVLICITNVTIIDRVIRVNSLRISKVRLVHVLRVLGGSSPKRVCRRHINIKF